MHRIFPGSPFPKYKRADTPPEPASAPLRTEFAQRAGAAAGGRVAVLDAGHGQQVLGDGRRHDAGTARSRDQTHLDRAALARHLARHRVRLADLVTWRRKGWLLLQENSRLTEGIARQAQVIILKKLKNDTRGCCFINVKTRTIVEFCKLGNCSVHLQHWF